MKRLKQIKIEKKITIPIIGKLTAYKSNNKEIDFSVFYALMVRDNHMSKEGFSKGNIIVVKNI